MVIGHTDICCIINERYTFRTIIFGWFFSIFQTKYFLFVCQAFSKLRSKPKFIVILWGLKPAQAWGCPYFIKYLFKDIRSAFIPALPLLSTLPFPIGCFGNKRTDTNVFNNRRDSSLFHPILFVVRVDS
jgi:hypothetical protein